MILSDKYFIDLHCHHSTKNIKVVEIENLMLEPRLEVPASGFFSIGIHPWFITEDSCLAINSLKQYLENENVIALGECGLDWSRKSISRSLQEQVFVEQIKLSEILSVPIIIHSVKSYSDLIRIRLNSKAKQPWIIHGFSSNSIMLNQLIEKGFFISFGPAIFRKTAKIIDVIQKVPLNKVFLETDNLTKRRVDICEIYSQFARLRKIRIDDLKEQIFKNFIHVFKNKLSIDGRLEREN
ncbi:MAG: TatD family hydrolase [Bacteroidales bacterium]